MREYVHMVENRIKAPSMIGNIFKIQHIQLIQRVHHIQLYSAYSSHNAYSTYSACSSYTALRFSRAKPRPTRFPRRCLSAPDKTSSAQQYMRGGAPSTWLSGRRSDYIPWFLPTAALWSPSTDYEHRVKPNPGLS